jgi:hypothetical protein
MRKMPICNRPINPVFDVAAPPSIGIYYDGWLTVLK